jgi:hypothetical protein
MTSPPASIVAAPIKAYGETYPIGLVWRGVAVADEQLRETSASDRQLAGLGACADIEFCGRADTTPAVPVRRPGAVLAIAVFEDADDRDGRPRTPPVGRVPVPPLTEVSQAIADRWRSAPSEVERNSDPSQPGPLGPLSAGRTPYWRSA